MGKFLPPPPWENPGCAPVWRHRVWASSGQPAHCCIAEGLCMQTGVCLLPNGRGAGKNEKRTNCKWLTQVMGGVSLHVRTCTPPPPPPFSYLRIRLTNCAKIWCVAGNPIVTRFTKIGDGVTAHSHVRLQFRCLGNRWALTLKPHQNRLISFALARSSPNMASYWYHDNIEKALQESANVFYSS